MIQETAGAGRVLGSFAALPVAADHLPAPGAEQPELVQRQDHRNAPVGGDMERRESEVHEVVEVDHVRTHPVQDGGERGGESRVVEGVRGIHHPPGIADGQPSDSGELGSPHRAQPTAGAIIRRHQRHVGPSLREVTGEPVSVYLHPAPVIGDGEVAREKDLHRRALGRATTPRSTGRPSSPCQRPRPFAKRPAPFPRSVPQANASGHGSTS